MPDLLQLIETLMKFGIGVMLIALFIWILVKALWWVRHLAFFLFGAGGEYRRLGVLRLKLTAVKTLARAAARYERELTRRPPL